jgi:hypothetical protein
MKRTINVVIGLLALLLSCQLLSAQTVVIPHTDRGWYTDTGFHEVGNDNYFVGDERGSGCLPCSSDIRNYFVFDLTGIEQPIASAKLTLVVPGPTPVAGYSSPDPSENYELHDVVTSIAALMDGTGGVAAHADLGSGAVYGSRTMTAADMGSVVEITLNSTAIAALDAATGRIGIGGSLTTLDGVANDEFTFAASGFSNFPTELRLTLVPEPTSGLMGLAAIIAVQARRNRKRRPC